MPKVLIIDDDKQLLQLLADWLLHQQYTVESVSTGEEACFRLSTYSYDAVILDWELPDMSGIQICKTYRADGGSTPIIMLTGRDQIRDKLEGLDIGADDYICKPANLEELSARLRAVLRRPQAVRQQIISVSDVEIDLSAKTLKVAGAPIVVQPRELELLFFLAQHPNEVFSAEALMSRIWPSESESSTDVIRVHVAKLRSKTGRPDLIKTVHGAGYKLES